MARSASGSLCDRRTGRGPLSRLAGARARPLAALVYAASEATPAARAPSLTSAKPQPRATELDECEVVARSLLVARGDGAEVFEFAKEPFNKVALAIQGKVGVSLLKTIRLGRYDWLYSPLLKGFDQGIGIIGFVSQERFGINLIEQRLGLTDVGRLARSKRQSDRIAECVDDNMYLGGQSATGAADGLILTFFFLAPALCW